MNSISNNELITTFFGMLHHLLFIYEVKHFFCNNITFVRFSFLKFLYLWSMNQSVRYERVWSAIGMFIHCNNLNISQTNISCGVNNWPAFFNGDDVSAFCVCLLSLKSYWYTLQIRYCPSISRYSYTNITFSWAFVDYTIFAYETIIDWYLTHFVPGWQSPLK